jgi:serine/threonine protein kinase
VKSCPDCGRLFPADSGFCPVDGIELLRLSQAPPAVSENDPRIGRVLCGNYEVRRVVADGGMGRVYEALSREQSRNVALKVLHPHVATDRVALERFRREFEVSRLISHEHVVEVYDFLPTKDGSYALVMEFLYGEELRSALRRERFFPPARLIRMLGQVALGLDAAHERQLVHRDLKPDNIFLCQTHDGDVVKILDFGSVKDKAQTAKKLTVLGTTIGSPYYMSPEQAQGLETLDRRADVWSLAAIAYECITGQLPFGGSNGPSILFEILTNSPRAPTSWASEAKYPIPHALDRVMAHAFQKAPGMRIPTVGDLADRIGQAYGLSGTHHVWVRETEAAVSQQVREGLAMDKERKPSVSPEGSAAGFFGDSLLESNSPPKAAAHAVPIPPAPRVPSELPEGVGSSGMPRWLVALIVILVVLLVAGAVVVMRLL